MKTLALLVASFAVAAFLAGCERSGAPSGPLAPSVTAEQSSVVHTAKLHVKELTCEGCASQIREILEPLPGVVAVRTNVKQKTVLVDLDASVISVDDVVAVLAREKYEAQHRPQPVL